MLWARCALAMTGGCRGAVERADVGIGPYGRARGPYGRAVGDAGPYERVSWGA